MKRVPQLRSSATFLTRVFASASRVGPLAPPREPSAIARATGAPGGRAMPPNP